MPIEIFGLTLKPEISISDIAAIGALIASPLIFWFGYNRSRKSEQIKIAREVMDRVEEKREKVNGIMKPSNPDEVGRRITATHSNLIGFFEEIRDWNIIRAYIPTLANGILDAEKSLNGLIVLLTVETVHSNQLRYDSELLKAAKGLLKVWFDKYLKVITPEGSKYRDFWDMCKDNPNLRF